MPPHLHSAPEFPAHPFSSSFAYQDLEFPLKTPSTFTKISNPPLKYPYLRLEIPMVMSPAYSEAPASRISYLILALLKIVSLPLPTTLVIVGDRKQYKRIPIRSFHFSTPIALPTAVLLYLLRTSPHLHQAYT